MTSCICEPSDPRERNGHSASCNRYQRKAASDSKKAAQKKAAKKPTIAKVGTKNTFECSDGTRVTQAEINKRLSASHVEIFSAYFAGRMMQLPGVCQGCGDRADSTAHIVPKARCKTLRKTELIWSIENQFKACWNCNLIAENVSSIGITKLLNYQRIKSFLELHDPERFTKLCYAETEIS